MQILAVIPARQGSKGVAKKNIRALCGKPLVVWTIDAALKCPLLSNTVVSTDSQEIRDLAIAAGAEAPFLRPAELATDRALAVPTIQHAVAAMETLKRVRYDYVVMLQPTSPLKTSDDIHAALARLIDDDRADGIISVVDVNNDHPMKMKRFLGLDHRSGRLVDYEKPPVENCPRQSLPAVFIVNGAIYATRRSVLMDRNSFQGDFCLGYEMPPERSVNIDDEFDFIRAEFEMVRQGRA